ncbi:MAG: hypothetical protein J7556_22230 [Acidovorax sp.]|nr:hypothetical protein [Acidovorax sp.]
MRAWRDFFPEVLPFIADGMPDPLLERHVLRVAQRFCERTRAWRATLEPIATLAGATNYEMELPQQAGLVRLEHALLDGVELSLGRADPRGQGRFVSTSDRKTVDLGFTPIATQALVLTASLKPANGAQGLEDFLFDQYAEDIAAGAVARINSDPLARESFEQRCDAVAAQLWRGSAAVRPRAMPHYF